MFDRHRHIVLFDAACYLIKQLILKRFGMFHHRFLIGIFGFQILQNLRILTLVKPIIVIHTSMTVNGHLMWYLF